MEEKALQIVKTLNDAGYIAYYAGGWVRDFLLHHPSDDIDIATNAPPDIIISLFPKTVPIGMAFGIVLVVIEEHPFEVATFRKDVGYSDGRRPTSVVFSDAQEDAKRRDFTINGMFYDPMTKEIFDFVGGKKDLNAKIIRAIGNPHERIQEDRLRMIRAIRLSSRFGFEIDEETKKAISAHAHELFPAVAMERIYQEFEKMALFQNFKRSLFSLFHFGLLQTIFPSLKNCSEKDLEKILFAVDDLPHRAPVIAKLLELFPNSSLDERLVLAKHLKLSNKDLVFSRFLFQAEKLIQREQNQEPIENVEWAYFYAHPDAFLCLEIIAAHFSREKKHLFLQNHEKRKNHLKKFIERIQNKDPLIKSHHLKMYKIPESPLMGTLLKEAERISVNLHTDNIDEVFLQLKKHPLWPKGF